MGDVPKNAADYPAREDTLRRRSQISGSRIAEISIEFGRLNQSGSG
jgi:hypothetical protein